MASGASQVMSTTSTAIIPIKPLTPSEVTVLRYYRSLKEKQFCRSLKTIAKACHVSTKTVARANRRFLYMGILLWVSGNSASWRPDSRGQANKYQLKLTGFYGFDVPPSQAARLHRLTGGRGQRYQTYQTHCCPVKTQTESIG